MASALSYELFQSKLGVANGVATLDANAKIPVSQLPDSVIETYKGEYATSAALITAHPLSKLADYAYVDATKSYWYWNSKLAIPAWVNQQISETAYIALTIDERSGVPYIVTP